MIPPDSEGCPPPRPWALALLFLELAGATAMAVGAYRSRFAPFYEPHSAWLDGAAIALAGALLTAGVLWLQRRRTPGGRGIEQLAIFGLPAAAGLLGFFICLFGDPRQARVYSLFERLAWIPAVLALAGILQWALPEAGALARIELAVSRKRRWTIAAVTGLAVFSVLILRITNVWGTIPIPTGDEPYYAIAADSLIDDGDLRLRNNTESASARVWYPSPLKVRPLLIHAPGLSIALVPFVAAGRDIAHSGVLPAGKSAILIFCARMPAVLSTALLAALTFALADALTRRRLASVFAGFLAGLSFPAAFVGTTIYPEMPMAACLAGAAYLVLAEAEPALWRIGLAGVLIGTAPWWGLKYAPAAGVIALGAAWMSRRKFSERLAALVAIGLPMGAFLAALGLYTHSLYGSFNPSSITGPMAARALEGVSWSNAGYSAQVLFGFLLDQKQGLLWKSPWMLLALAGIPLALRHHRKAAVVLGLGAAVHLVHYAYYQNWGLAGPPGRPAASIAWILAVLLAAGWEAAPARRTVSVAALALGIVSLVTVDLMYSDTGLVSLHYKWGDVPEWHPIFQWIGSAFRLPITILPDFMTVDARRLQLAVWAVASVVLIVILSRRVSRDGGSARRWPVAIALLPLAILVQAPYMGRLIFNLDCVRSKIGDVVYFAAAPMPWAERRVQAEDGGFWIRGSREAPFAVIARTPPEGLKITARTTGPAHIEVRYFDRRQELRTPGEAEVLMPSRDALWDASTACILVSVRVIEGSSGGARSGAAERSDEDETPAGHAGGVWVRFEPLGAMGPSL